MNALGLLEHFDRLIDTPDAVPRLRRFILDLAVRGKLVEQDPKDEPAGELLKRIQTEKTRLVKAGEIRKERPLPPVDEDTTPFGLPSLWEWASIRQITTDRGQKIPEKKFSYVDVSAINKERGEIADLQILTPDAAPSRARKIVKKGDVIYSCVRPYLLNIAVVEKDFNPEPIVSTAFAVLNGFGLIHPRYLWIVLRSPFFVECVEGKMRGQAYPAINDADFAPLPVPLPPLAEQTRIVAKVDELMALCDELEAAQTKRERRRDSLVAATLHGLNDGDATPTPGAPSTFEESARFYFNHLPRLTTRPEHIHQLRQTILNLAVRGKLVLQDSKDEPASHLLKRIGAQKAKLATEGKIGKKESAATVVESDWPYKPPSGWSWVRWNSIALKIGDVDHKMPEASKIGYPYVSPRDFRSDNTIDFDGAKTISEADFLCLSKKIKPDRGDIIYPRYGTIGENRLVQVQRDFLASYSCAVIKLLPGFIEPMYQYLYSISDLAKEQAKAAENKATQPNVGIKSIKEYLFPLPPLAEQQRIVAKVEELVALCDGLVMTLNAATTTQRRLLHTNLLQALPA